MDGYVSFSRYIKRVGPELLREFSEEIESISVFDGKEAVIPFEAAEKILARLRDRPEPIPVPPPVRFRVKMRERIIVIDDYYQKKSVELIVLNDKESKKEFVFCPVGSLHEVAKPNPYGG